MCLTPPLSMDTTKISADGRLSIRRELAGTILITGGLGFLGSVALESLLRNCPQVRACWVRPPSTPSPLCCAGKAALAAASHEGG